MLLDYNHFLIYITKWKIEKFIDFESFGELYFLREHVKYSLEHVLFQKALDKGVKIHRWMNTKMELARHS